MEREIQILGFNYSKISAERSPDFKGKLEISPNINIKSIEKHDLKVIKQDALKISFLFAIKYKNLGEVALEGDIILKTDAKTQKEILKGWKDKKLDQDSQAMILNLIMQKASVRAIELEEEMNLPIHIRIPKLQVSKKE